VGKSTFLNTVLDYRLVATSAVPQTTRRRWLGIYSDDRSQLLFLDTPGVHRPKLELGEAMLHSVSRALEDADVCLCLADATRSPGDEDAQVAANALKFGKPVVVAVNKCDVAAEAQIRAQETFFGKHLAGATMLRTVALDPEQTRPVLDTVRDLLPEGPFFYPADHLTDAYQRQIGAEFIREAVLELYREEVPHAIAVDIEEWKETDRDCRIRAVLYVEREQQKGIVIGKGGSALKKLCRLAEQKLSDLCDRPRLRIWVKVERDWRKRRGVLRDLGLGSGTGGR